MDERRVHHLDMVQTVISRMSMVSGQVKTWTVTLVAALFALAAKDANPNYFLIALLPAVAFWFVDAYYLSQERLFRCLYDYVRTQTGPVDFSMDTRSSCAEASSVASTIFSVTLFGFYGPILLAIGITSWAAGR